MNDEYNLVLKTKHMKYKKIEVVPCDPSWPQQFEKEAKKLREVLGQEVVAIHHIGSTSVPGLDSKNSLDILLVVNNLNSSLLLQDIGCTFQNELNIPLRYFFSKNTAERKVNLHVCEADHSFVDIQLAFRDWLRNHEEDRAAYQQLKYELAKDPEAGKRVQGILPKYNLGKNAFIKETLQKAGYDKLILNFCFQASEWEAAKHYRNKYFFEPKSLEDPYTWTFTHEDHKHFALYQGVEIVGYAHVQLWPGKRAAIRMMVIDEARRGQGHGSALMHLLEQWLKLHNYKSVHIESAPAAYNFYTKLGFLPMAFNDPGSYKSDPEDIAMGKVF